MREQTLHFDDRKEKWKEKHCRRHTTKSRDVGGRGLGVCLHHPVVVSALRPIDFLIPHVHGYIQSFNRD